MLTRLAVYVVLPLVVSYLYLLSRRLRTRNPRASPHPPPTEADYKNGEKYSDINMLEAIPSTPTHTGYAVIGGSGFLGKYLIRLLLLRGETSIRVLDLHPPPKDLLEHPAVSFEQTDITSLPSVRAALSKKFASTNAPPTVVYHMAAIIRMWDRRAYTWPLSYKINVLGTANVLAAVRELPDVTTLIYTSTADAAVQRQNFQALAYSSRVIFSDEDPPLAEHEASQSCYTRSKRMSEDLVKAANGDGGLKTGIIRPGYTIVGINDRLISSTLQMPVVPVFDKTFSQQPVNAWDVCAAHLLLEDALARRPQDVAGEAFIISGPHELWTLENIRKAIKHYSTRPLVFREVPPLIIYSLAHAIELFLYTRWHILSAVHVLLRVAPPSLAPAWLGQALIMQPATLEYLMDVGLDDSRARGLLGYRPRWGFLQSVKYVVDAVENGEAGDGYGLQTKALHGG